MQNNIIVYEIFTSLTSVVDVDRVLSLQASLPGSPVGMDPDQGSTTYMSVTLTQGLHGNTENHLIITIVLFFSA